MKILKAVAHRIHSVVRRSTLFSSLYLRTLGFLCRALPDAQWKVFVLNSVTDFAWPFVEFPAAEVRYPGSNVGARIVPHINEFDVSALIFRELPYEPEGFRWFAGRRYRTVIEIGANVGVFSLFLAQRFPDAAVYAFEPSRAAFARLLVNLSLNRCPNLIPFNCAVFSRSGFLSFHEPEGHLTNGSLDVEFAKLFSGRIASATVAAMSAGDLDALIVGTPVLIKIDVEGVEPELLRALQPLIERHRPDLLIEVLPWTEDALNALEFLSDGSYELFHIEQRATVRKDKFESGEWRDWAVLPASPAVPFTGPV